jgi:hypothetical protein
MCGEPVGHIASEYVRCIHSLCHIYIPTFYGTDKLGRFDLFAGKFPNLDMYLRRVSQDNVENIFSRIRAGQGGCRDPDVMQAGSNLVREQCLATGKEVSSYTKNSSYPVQLTQDIEDNVGQVMQRLQPGARVHDYWDLTAVTQAAQQNPVCEAVVEAAHVAGLEEGVSTSSSESVQLALGMTERFRTLVEMSGQYSVFGKAAERSASLVGKLLPALETPAGKDLLGRFLNELDVKIQEYLPKLQPPKTLASKKWSEGYTKCVELSTCVQMLELWINFLEGTRTPAASEAYSNFRG